MGNVLLHGWDSINEVWVKLLCNAEGKLIIDPSEIFEDVPTDNEHGKAPTSDWAYDHKADASAHHVRYSDADAQAACKLSGTLYYSAPGTDMYVRDSVVKSVDRSYTGIITALEDGIKLMVGVHLPHGATVTRVIVTGNAGAMDVAYALVRSAKDGSAVNTMAGTAIGLWDTTIANAVIDNNTYSYNIYTAAIDTADAIYAIVIGYTI